MWNKPWSIKEGLIVGAGLLLTGEMLQLTVGAINWNVFAWPVNAIVLSIFCVLMLIGYRLRDNIYAFRFQSSSSAAVAALLYALTLTVIMGLFIQVGEFQEPVDPIGLTKMLSYWPFMLVYLWVAIIVAQTTIHQVLHFKLYFVPSLLSHIGILLILVCGTLGSADMQRLKMYCEMNQPEWRGLDNRNNIQELPIAVQLDKFIMEQYEGGQMPKRFASEVEIMTKDGKHVQTTIEVNKPFTIGGWTIYQYGYDQEKGPMSRYSIFELVKDPWLSVVYVGIYMMLAGAVLLFIIAQRRKKKRL